ncbi:HAD family hydrolase [Tautonia sociabilis]|uniref:HAD family hydrolase n=1 Tax=Tautonia sociabilis TaxID=2080755 RepID=A0A432MRV2_9BACT|nr:HAD family hydrolase [Tautonia sociabilis]RUL89717.1 HAD family hydrolase [Tautonia sociabilis]
MQRHMDHFRDAKLLLDNQPILEGFEGYIGSREKSGRRKEWHGYFLAEATVHLDPEQKYTLVLGDGTTAMIRGSDIAACEADGGTRHAVEFYVVGDLRGTGRRHHGLEHEARRPLS